MINEFNDASAIIRASCIVGDVATREDAGVEASLSPDVVERVARAIHDSFMSALIVRTRTLWIDAAKAAISAIQQTGG